MALLIGREKDECHIRCESEGVIVSEILLDLICWGVVCMGAGRFDWIILT